MTGELEVLTEKSSEMRNSQMTVTYINQDRKGLICTSPSYFK